MRRVAREAVGETIHVETCDALPVRLFWRGIPYRVLSVDGVWCAEGRWWLDPMRDGCHRRYYRLSVASPARVVLCVEVFQQRGLWKIWRLAD